MNVKKNFIYNLILSICQIILPIITFPYVTRTLLPKSLGDVNFIDNIIQYIAIIVALGVPLYGTREIARVRNEKEKVSQIFSELFILHLSNTVVGSLIFLACLLLIPELSNHIILGITGIGILISNVFTIPWLYSGLEEFSYTTKVNLAVRIISIISIFVFVKSPDDKTIYYGITLLSNFLIGIIGLYHSRKFINLTFKNLSFRKHLKPLFLLFSLTVITSVYVLLDAVILGFLKNTVEVGYYSVSMKISKIPISVISALTTVMLPTLSRISANKVELSRLIKKSLDVIIMLSIPIAIGIFCLSSDLVIMFGGNKFIGSISSLKVLSFVIIPIGVALVAHQILLPLNKEKLMMNIAIIGLCVSVILNFLLIPLMGSVGCAIASLSTEVVVSSILFIASKKLVSIILPFKIILQSLIVSLSFFLIRMIISSFVTNSIVIILATAIIGSIFYFSAFAFILKNHFILENLILLKNKIIRNTHS